MAHGASYIPYLALYRNPLPASANLPPQIQHQRVPHSGHLVLPVPHLRFRALPSVCTRDSDGLVTWSRDLENHAYVAHTHQADAACPGLDATDRISPRPSVSERLSPAKEACVHLADAGDSLTACLPLFAAAAEMLRATSAATLSYSEGSYLTFLTLVTHLLSPDTYFKKYLQTKVLKIRMWNGTPGEGTGRVWKTSRVTQHLCSGDQAEGQTVLNR